MDLIMPFVGLAIIITAIVLLVKFRHKIMSASKVSTFYNEMERSKNREEKQKKVGKFLSNCYYGGYADGKRTCPVCGNYFKVAETVTDENGDESKKYSEKKCPRCSVMLYRDRCSGRTRYEIERDVQVKKKYKENYVLLMKYIDVYGSFEPEIDFSGDDSHFIYI